jgi:hypothetical protein
MRLLLLLCLLTLLTAPAYAADIADDIDNPETPGAGVAPWPADTPLEEVGHDDFGYRITIPVGGEYHTEAEMSLDRDADPLDYPFIWTNVDAPLEFDMIMLGVLQGDTPLDEAGFAEILAAEHASMLEQFPHAIVTDELIQTTERGWMFSAYWTADDSSEVARFSTYSGGDYYSLFLFGPTEIADIDVHWAQLIALLEGFFVEE